MIKRIVVFLIIFAFFSCGNEAPTISFPTYHILVYENGALQSPNENMFLSLYFLISDDNGIDDIKSVKLTHIDTEYSWTLNKDELKSVDWENKTYHGYSFFEYDNAKSVLLGDYNIEIEDGGGNIGNTIFRVEIENTTEDILRIPQIAYKPVKSEDGKEIKIEGGDFFSVEIKYSDNPDIFNGGRKKFGEGEKIILNQTDGKLPGRILSIKINSDVNETFVYFLKDFYPDE